MKKISLVLLIAVMSCLSISTHMNATDAIYLKNNYGAPLTCKFMTPVNNTLVTKDQKTLADGQSMFLMDPSKSLEGVSDIWVTTGGAFSNVSGLGLLSTLAPIINQRNSNKQKYAVITIKPTRWTWQIEVTYTNDKPE